MRKYKLKELRELVRLGVAEDYTNKPSEYIYTLRRLEKVGYSTGVYGINGGFCRGYKAHSHQAGQPRQPRKLSFSPFPGMGQQMGK